MREALLKSLEPVVQGLGYELLELELAQSRGGGTLRLYIDKPDGVTVDDCAAVSNAVSATLDAEDLLPGRYTLEVSSPGFDRVLRKPEHFARFVGEPVQVELALAQDGRRRFAGPLKALRGDADAGYEIVVEVDKKDYVLPLARIHKARLKPR